MSDELGRGGTAAAGGTNYKSQILRSRMVVVPAILLISLVLALGVYRFLFSSKEKGILSEFTNSVSKSSIGLSEVAKLVNQNANDKPGKGEGSLEKYSNSVTERDKRILNALEEQEKLISQEEEMVENLNSSQIKESATTYVSEYKKYVGLLHQLFIKTSRADEKYKSLVGAIKDGKINTTDVKIQIKEIDRDIETNLTAVEDYNFMQMNNSYLSLIRLIHKNYASIEPKLPDKPYVIEVFDVKPSQVNQAIESLMLEVLKKRAILWHDTLTTLTSDKQKSVKLLETFIEPSSARTEKATEFYNNWTTNSSVIVISNSVDDVKIGEDGIGSVRYSTVFKLPDFSKKVVSQTTTWKQVGGQWYRIID